MSAAHRPQARANLSRRAVLGGGLALVGLGALGLARRGCGGDRPPVPVPLALGAAAAAAAREHGVPEVLVLALAYAESRGARLDFGGGQRGWVRLPEWPPALRLSAGAALIGAPRDEVRADARLGLRAAAALLASDARDLGVPLGAPLARWRPVLARFRARDDELANALFADGLLRIAAAGFAGHDDEGHAFEAAPQPELGEADDLAAPRPADVVGAVTVPYWPAGPSTFRSPLAGPRVVRHVVVHATQGAFDTIFAYFRRPTTKVAAHYLVRAHDGVAVQMVDERAVAFHAACFNETSIGIEHEGFVEHGALWFGDAQYRASAAILADAAQRWGIPLDREHVLGHAEAPTCSDHQDPGPQWDWAKYLGYAREALARGGERAAGASGQR